MKITNSLHFVKWMVVAGTCFASLNLPAQIISINVAAFATDVQQIDTSETYGVLSLGSVVGGWKNTGSYTLTDVAFSDGSSSTVDMTILGPGGLNSAAAGYNNTPMKGFVADYTTTPTPTSLTLSQINTSFASGYLAIVYLSGFNLNRGASITDGTSTFFYQPVDFTVNTWNGTLVQTTTTTDLGSGNAPVAQYAVFGSSSSPLTANSITFTLDTLYGGGAGIGGVQLVAVPEPSAALTGLLGVGLFILSQRKYRI